MIGWIVAPYLSLASLWQIEYEIAIVFPFWWEYASDTTCEIKRDLE